MTQFNNLQPKPIWDFFSQILTIPRPSDQEELVRAHLIEFAQNRGLDHEVDSAGNLMIRKKATPGMEKRQSV